MLWHGILNAFMLRPDRTKRIESWPGSSGPALIEPFALAGPSVMRHGRMDRFGDAEDVVAREHGNRAVSMRKNRRS